MSYKKHKITRESEKTCSTYTCKINTPAPGSYTCTCADPFEHLVNGEEYCLLCRGKLPIKQASKIV